MYEYIRQWPANREMGWSHDVNGVCHDLNNWFFSQNGYLWKFPIKHRIGNDCTQENRAQGIYRVNPKKNLEAWLGTSVSDVHLGDIDYYNGYVYVPVGGETSKASFRVVCFFKSDDLSYAGQQIILREDNVPFTSLGWLAINPSDGMLYTSDKIASNVTQGSESRIHLYKIGDMTKPNPLQFHSTTVLTDEDYLILKREHMQGGCFDNDNHLHIMNGYVTHDKGTRVSWANSKGGISVFKVSSTPSAGYTQTICRLTHSNQSNGFRFQFSGTGEEPEGLTYWDLDKDTRAPEIDGQLHAIMIDNLGKGDDDFFFKHYRKNANAGFYLVTVKTGNVENAGTDAGIFITFFGEKGASNECELDSSRDDFERGHTDRFVVETDTRVGTLRQILIRSNNSGKYAEFYLESVTVWDIEANKNYVFPANQWLTGNKKNVILTPRN